MGIAGSLFISLALFAPSGVAAASTHTGFVLDSGVGEGLGQGEVVTGEGSSLVGSLNPTTGYYTITGTDIENRPWSIGFKSQYEPTLPVRNYTGGFATMHVSQGSKVCNMTGESFDVLEAPVVNGAGAITAFAVDFRGTCFSGGPLHGSVRLGSAFPVGLLRVTSKLVFPDTVTGTTSPIQEVHVLNIGETTIHLGTPRLTGTDADQFTLDDDCAGLTTNFEDECTISVAFAPSVTKAKTATVVLPNDAVDGDRTTPINGYALSPLTLLPSAIVFDGRDHALTAGPDVYYDPAVFVAGGDPDSVNIFMGTVTLFFNAPVETDMEAGTYTDVSIGPGAESFGLNVVAPSMPGTACPAGVDQIDGTVTILQPPVLDTDGRLLQFAADFTQHCVDVPGTLRGWVRFHSSLPVPKFVPPAYSVTANATTAKVGDTITITPHPIGVDFFDHQRCQMSIGRAGDDPSSGQSMQASSDDCAPWTFTLPPTATGHFDINGSMWFGDQAGIADHNEGAQSLSFDVIPGGAHVPYQTNYPVPSWAMEDGLGEGSPSFGSTQTMKAPPNATGCRMYVFTGGIDSWTQQEDACHSWTFTLASHGPLGGFFGPATRFRAFGWSGASTWAIDDPEQGLIGSRFGQAYRASTADMTGTDGSFSSNVPAIFSPASRLSVTYVDDPPPAPWAPVVVGATDGSCRDNVSHVIHAVSDGGCGTYAVPDWTSPYNGSSGNRIQLRDVDGNQIGETIYEVGFALHMAPVTVDVDPVVQLGTDMTIAAGTTTGTPAGYTVEVAATAGSASTFSSSASGADIVASFQGEMPTGPDHNGGNIDVVAPGLAAGSYQVTVQFTDIKGETKTSSKDVIVADTVGPVGAIVVDGGATYTTSTAVSLSLLATDISGVTDVALSNDGSHWTTLSDTTSTDWALLSGDGVKKVWAKWRDGLGHWSAPIFDTITLDTVAPRVTATSRSIRSGTAFVASHVTVRIGWVGTDAGSGIASYQLDRNVDGGSWVVVSDHLTSSLSDQSLATGHSYRFRTRATDKFGRVGAWTYGTTFHLTRREDTSSLVTFRGTWHRSTSSVYTSSSARTATAAGAKASIRTSARSIGFISRVGPTRGSATVYVDGKKVATINLHASAAAGPRVVWSKTWASVGTHTVVVRVSGTHGHPSVVVDSFVVSN